METKNWYESKSIWASLGFIALALWHYDKSGDIVKAIELLLLSCSIIGIRTGYQKIQ
jgi:hypothetical protein